jgi:AraC-like DNA-binding protein
MIIFGLGLSLFFCILLITKKQKSNADILLSVWLLFIALHLFFFYAYVNDIFRQFPFLIGIDFSFPILQALFLYFYVRLLTSGRQRFYLYDLFHLIPSLSAYIYMIPFFLKAGTDKYLYYQEIEIRETIFLYIFNLITILSFVTYTVLAFWRLKKHEQHIKQFYSFKEKVQLKWMKSLVTGLSVIWLIVLTIKILHLVFLVAIPFSGVLIISISVVIFVFFLGFFGIRQTTVFSDLNFEDTSLDIPIERYKKSGLKVGQVEFIKENLIRLMESENRFQDNELALDRLAKDIGTSANNLSQVINEQFSKNFYDFINDYRIDDFKRKAVDPKFKNYSIIALAFECGFNSKSAFYQAFKKQTGISPGEYLKNNIC